MASPQLAKAVLIPIDDDRPSSDPASYIVVQFNPASLRVSLSNTLKADTRGGGSNTSAQFIDKSESSLTVELLFDTTVGRSDSVELQVRESDDSTVSRSASAAHEANSDVRLLTKRIAETFMKPLEQGSGNPRAPKRCRFQWGSFSFDGMLSSYNENLDFFSPEGVPLRATLQLGFKEDRYEFESAPTAAIGPRAQPSFAPGGAGISADKAAQAAGQDPRQWRDTALFNGLETPRFSASIGLSVPGVSLQAGLGAAAGFSAGASASVGTAVPGAFVAVGAPTLDARTGVIVKRG